MSAQMEYSEVTATSCRALSEISVSIGLDYAGTLRRDVLIKLVDSMRSPTKALTIRCEGVQKVEIMDFVLGGDTVLEIFDHSKDQQFNGAYSLSDTEEEVIRLSSNEIYFSEAAI